MCSGRSASPASRWIHGLSPSRSKEMENAHRLPFGHLIVCCSMPTSARRGCVGYTVWMDGCQAASLQRLQVGAKLRHEAEILDGGHGARRAGLPALPEAAHDAAQLLLGVALDEPVDREEGLTVDRIRAERLDRLHPLRGRLELAQRRELGARRRRAEEQVPPMLPGLRKRRAPEHLDDPEG